MNSCRVKLKNKCEVAENAMTFEFEKPRDFRFIAGQFIILTLIDPLENDQKGNSRPMSIASAPHEDYLLVLTRLSDSAFKQNLMNLALGSEVEIKGPLGSLCLNKDISRPQVMLAGGVGVAPLRSMIFYSVHEQTGHKIYLFYCNRRPESAPFLKIFQKLESAKFHFIPTMTRMNTSKKQWHGECGRINPEMIQRHLPKLTDSDFYIVGPPQFVKDLSSSLEEAGVNKKDIRTEVY
ncbi:hypothetical protein B5M47_02970 [candidate division CPR3 bacterium 4484_211]|uniref:FAD-binding FR-type domain-containing protein n=1 Tax=candidate division CPR3 bacterium 4484_211 TaxID=1968527 RepID=A0A1W9NXF0_UNCC3|nr:MAG: hypothetical protein B5M47_02970 [candidate division CPR3 bacterium 4484_211]